MFALQVQLLLSHCIRPSTEASGTRSTTHQIPFRADAGATIDPAPCTGYTNSHLHSSPASPLFASPLVLNTDIFFITTSIIFHSPDTHISMHATDRHIIRRSQDAGQRAHPGLGVFRKIKTDKPNLRTRRKGDLSVLILFPFHSAGFSGIFRVLLGLSHTGMYGRRAMISQQRLLLPASNQTLFGMVRQDRAYRHGHHVSLFLLFQISITFSYHRYDIQPGRHFIHASVVHFYQSIRVYNLSGSFTRRYSYYTSCHACRATNTTSTLVFITTAQPSPSAIYRSGTNQTSD